MTRAAMADLREQIGIAVNASSLRIVETGESHLDRIAALGAAAADIARGADLAGLPIAAMQADVIRRASAGRRDACTADPRAAIVAELGPMMWRIVYGKQDALVSRAAGLFAGWLGFGRRYAALTETQRLRLADCAVRELSVGPCRFCGGSGKLERARSGKWIAPSYSLQRYAVFRPCASCGGSGRAFLSGHERAAILGLDVAGYEAGRWRDLVVGAKASLGHEIMRRVRRPLTRQLERRISRI